jgi:hypothetical protein
LRFSRKLASPSALSGVIRFRRAHPRKPRRQIVIEQLPAKLEGAAEALPWLGSDESSFVTGSGLGCRWGFSSPSTLLPDRRNG